jgi:damage-control phosphatase, subfamily I
LNIWPDCIPCILKMSLDVARLSLKDEEDLKAFVSDVLAMPPMRGEKWNISPPEIIRDIWGKIVGITNDPDPLREMKAEQNRKALRIYEQARDHARKSADPFLASLRFVIAANAMDVMVGVGRSELSAAFETGRMAITVAGAEQLRKRLDEANRIVYLTDNCGEVVFDRLFLEVLGERWRRNITVVVRGLPILNDATMLEARSVGLDQVAPVIENGITTPYPGTRLDLVSARVRDLLLKADLIISKGGGNLESLTEEIDLKGKTAFLFQGKCHPCCRPRDVALGTLIVAHL